jgi:CheY-like chemotaxis protein
LGLAISSQLAQRMHGRMWVESRPGEGAVFRFTMLVRTPEAARRSEPLPPGLRERRALIIEDNLSSRTVLERLGSRFGLKTVSVEDAPAALAALDPTAAFDVTLCDTTLPDCDGFELARDLVRRSEAGAVLMLVLAADRHHAPARCREIGAAGYLVKPLRGPELLERLTDALHVGRSGSGREPTPDRPEAAARSGLRVLLAEDNPINQQVALRMLRRRGYEVTVVTDGRRAIEAAAEAARAEQAFDVVLMDIQMPVLSGLEATHRIRQSDEPLASVPIVAMTAHALKGDRERCLAAGMDGYLSKPINAEELFELIEQLARRRPEKEQAGRSPAYDRVAAVAQLAGDEQLFRELASIFVEQYPRSLEQLRSARAAADAAQVQRLAHTLKGSVATFCAREVLEVIRDLEAAGCAGDLAAIDRSLPVLQEELQRLDRDLRRLL